MMLKPGLYSIFVLRDDESWVQPVYRVTSPIDESEFKYAVEVAHNGFISYGIKRRICVDCKVENLG